MSKRNQYPEFLTSVSVSFVGCRVKDKICLFLQFFFKRFSFTFTAHPQNIPISKSITNPVLGTKKIIFKEDKQGFCGGSVVKNSPANAGEMGLISDPGRSDIPQGR